LIPGLSLIPILLKRVWIPKAKERTRGFSAIEETTFFHKTFRDVGQPPMAYRKKIIPLRNSYHVATMDHEKEWIAAQCSSFVQEIAHIESRTEI